MFYECWYIIKEPKINVFTIQNDRHTRMNRNSERNSKNLVKVSPYVP